MSKSKPKTPEQDLPPDVLPDDLKYASGMSYEDSNLLTQKVGEYENRTLEFYQTTGFGWVLCTLPITGGKRGRADRTYGVDLKGQTCRVGNGPHVLQQVTVYVTLKNLSRLQKYVDLKIKGLTRAGEIRDRISTRRARGQEYRAQGRTSWFW